MLNREQALAILNEFTTSVSLLKHARAVEISMRYYAKLAGLSDAEIERYGITGLLHDFDYDTHPDTTPPDGHPYFGNRVLEERGVDSEIREAIMGHALYTGVARTTQLAKTLFAVDELSGFVTAATLVRPDKSIFTLEVSSVKKRLKDKAFAKGCNREEIAQGAAELGIEMDQHITNIIAALREHAEELGLAGTQAASQLGA